MPKMIKGVQTDKYDYACGACYSLMEGDESICPVCGVQNNFNDPKIMTIVELTRAYMVKHKL